MYYNEIFSECSYTFNENHASQLFERLAHNLLSYLLRNENYDDIEYAVHTKMYATGEFMYNLKAYKDLKVVASYLVNNYIEEYSENIFFNGSLIYYKGTHKNTSLIWDRKFFGIDHNMYGEEIMSKLKDYEMQLLF